MWIRKTRNELSKVRRKVLLDFWGPLLFFIIAFFISTIYALAGPVTPFYRVPHPLFSYWNLLLRLIVVSLITSFLTYLCQLLIGKPFLIICNRAIKGLNM